jgi:hypothetical protein
MKKEPKVSIKVRDLEPLKNVTAGRRRRHRLHARAFALRDGPMERSRGLGQFGLNRPQ